MILPDILHGIGETPMVEIRRLNPNPAVKILAKIEFTNPGGSIKDRVAMAMIQAAEERGELTPDKTVIEATSGNTGIGLAMVCAVKGYRLMLLMSQSASEERKRILRAYGAEIKLTPPHLGTDGAIEEAYRLAREEPNKYVLVDQFNNPSSIEAHYLGTGLEIWNQTEGKVSHVVVCLGTSGTIMGVAKRLKEMNPAVRVVAMEPYAGHKIQGLKNMQESYPPGIYDKSKIDEFIRVEDEEAYDMARRLAREEGMFVGMSSGAAMAASIKLAKRLESGTIVTILPDGGERYLSTALFTSKTKAGPRFLNAATGKEAVLSLESGPLGLFTMGPPLDRLGDLESWRRIVLTDVLLRHLSSQTERGVQVEAAAGLADLDDRAIEAARAAGMSRQAFANRALGRIGELAATLHLSPEFGFGLACESSDRALELTSRLLAKGQAYEKLRSVYFDVRRFEPYGDLASSHDMDKLSLGKTVDLQAYLKENAQDFTLLKRATLQDLKAQDCWTTQWGNVRPSWFLQHVSAALDKLPAISLFVAGEAHRFPHLENFRAILAQSAQPLPQVWLLSQPVAAREAENLPGLETLLGEYEPAALRMWLLSASHHRSLSSSDETLSMWRKNWQRVQRLAVELSLVQADAGRAKPREAVDQLLVDVKKSLRDAMEQDLSLHKFWPELLRFCREVGRLAEAGELTPSEAAQCLARLKSLDRVLGILDLTALPLPRHEWPAKIAALVEQREEARKARDFERADALREEIESLGCRLEDTAKGARVYGGK